MVLKNKMSIQQLNNKQRIQFLVEFIGNIVQHSTEDERLKRLIKVERLKRKIIPEPPLEIEQVGKSVVFEEPKEDFQKSKTLSPVKKSFHLKKAPKKMIGSDSYKKSIVSRGKALSTDIQHETRSTDQLMVKLNKIINDKSVQMIECPGPGKNVLVKIRNKVNVTKLNLNEAEIKNIIIYFSDYARIPIVGGILKTSVDNIMISAVVSEYAGSRFIINKKNPYDLIERM